MTERRGMTDTDKANGRFVELPDSFRDQYPASSRGSQWELELSALIEGKTIFLPDAHADGKEVRTIRTVLGYRSRSAGTPLRLVTRQALIDGRNGMALWAVSREPDR